MARNKRHVEQKIKKEEIELVAMQLLKEQGYDNTSMAKIAKAAGVAPNTIYWYYENKDDVLIAVLNRVVAQAMVAVLALQNEPLKERVLKLICLNYRILDKKVLTKKSSRSCCIDSFTCI